MTQGAQIQYSDNLGGGIGREVGFAIGEDADLMVGPSAELAFEIKHLVISLNGYYNAIQNKHFGVAGGLFANIGYKF